MLRIVLLLLIFFICAGCEKNQGAKQLVQCNGDLQTKLIASLERDGTSVGTGFPSLKYDIARSNYYISDVRTIEQNEKRAICRAVLSTVTGLTADGVKTEEAGLAEQSGLARRLAIYDRKRNISYTVRLTDDKTKMFIEDTAGFITPSDTD
jgi:hypothetical protein